MLSVKINWKEVHNNIKMFRTKQFNEIVNHTKYTVIKQTNDGFFAPHDLNYLSVPWYMNHSCSYNVGFDNKGNYITARIINNGEELVTDYGLSVSDPDYKLLCKCKSKNCRKIITGNDWRNDRFVEKNKNYFLRELLAVRKKNSRNTSKI